METQLKKTQNLAVGDSEKRDPSVLTGIACATHESAGSSDKSLMGASSSCIPSDYEKFQLSAFKLSKICVKPGRLSAAGTASISSSTTRKPKRKFWAAPFTNRGPPDRTCDRFEPESYNEALITFKTSTTTNQGAGGSSEPLMGVSIPSNDNKKLEWTAFNRSRFRGRSGHFDAAITPSTSSGATKNPRQEFWTHQSSDIQPAKRTCHQFEPESYNKAPTPFHVATTTHQEAGGSSQPLMGASSSSIPSDEEKLGWTAFYRSRFRVLPGHFNPAVTPNTSLGATEKPRQECGTNSSTNKWPPKRTHDQFEPGSYSEALTTFQMATATHQEAGGSSQSLMGTSSSSMSSNDERLRWVSFNHSRFSVLPEQCGTAITSGSTTEKSRQEFRTHPFTSRWPPKRTCAQFERGSYNVTSTPFQMASATHQRAGSSSQSLIGASSSCRPLDYEKLRGTTFTPDRFGVLPRQFGTTVTPNTCSDVTEKPKKFWTPPSTKNWPPKRTEDLSESRSYNETLTRFRMAIIRENFPDDKLEYKDIKLIQTEVLRKFDDSPAGEALPLLKSFELIAGALIYVCANPQTCQWLVRALDKCSIGERIVLKVIEAKDLPKPVKVAFRTRDSTTSNIQKLLCRLKAFNPELAVENWKVLDRKADKYGQRLVFLVDRGSYGAIKKADFVAYTGLDQGRFKTLMDPEVMPTESTPAGSKDGFISQKRGEHCN